MLSLVEVGLANALTALPLALAALLAGRYSRQPALIHALWLLVLVKLVTPPLIRLPLPWPVPPLLHQPEPTPPARPPVPVRAVPPPPAAIPPESEDAAERPGPFTRLDELAGDPEAAARKMIAQGKMAPPPPQQPPPDAANAEPPAGVEVPDSAPPVAEPAAYRLNWRVLVGGIWVLGAFYCYVLAAWRVALFRRLLCWSRPAPEPLRQKTARLAEQIGLPYCPEVRLLPGPVPPLVWALGSRPRVYFPETLLEQLTEQGRTSLLLHELAHLKRRDHQVRVLELLVAGLHWWNPLVWVACQRLQAAEEECCDAWVVGELIASGEGNGNDYATALLETVDFLAGASAAPPPTASGFGKVYYLKRRLTMISSGTTPRGLSLAGRILVLSLALLLPLVPAPSHSAAPPAVASSAEDVVAAEAVPIAPQEATAFQRPQRSFLGGGGQVWAVAVSPDGKTAAYVAGAIGDNPGDLVLFDLPGRKEKAFVREEKQIRCVTWSPDGSVLVTGDFDNKIKLRDPATGKIRRVLEGHTEAINGLAFLPGGKHLVSASLDKTLRIQEVSTGRLLHTLTGHTDRVLCLAVSRDGGTIVSGSRDRTAKVWDVKTGKERLTLTGHTNAVETIALDPTGKRVATGSWDGSIRLWNTETGKELQVLTGHDGNVNAVGFSPDGRLLASGGGDRTLRLWNPESGAQKTILAGHNERIHGLAFSPEGDKILSASWDKTVKVWDVAEQKEEATLQARLHGPEASFPVFAVACSPDGRYLAVAGEDKTVQILDARTGFQRFVLEGHDDAVASVAFSPDSQTLATASFDRTVKLWDVATGRERRTLNGHENWVFSVTFSQDGKRLASGSLDRTVRIWDPGTGREVTVLRKHRGGVRAVAFSPDGQRLVSGSTDRTVRIWNLTSGDVMVQFKGHEDAIRAVAWSPDGQMILSGGEDTSVRLWDVATEKQLRSFNQGDSVLGLAFSPRGRVFASVSLNRTVRITDTRTGQSMMNVPNVHNDGVTSVCFDPQGQALFTGSLDRTVRRWEAAAPTVQAARSFRERTQQMSLALTSPDGRWLYTGGSDRVLRKIDLNLGRSLGNLPQVPSVVYGLAVSPDGKTLALGCQDQKIHLWNVQQRKREAVLEGHRFRVWCVSFSPDGKFLASAAGSWENANDPGEVKVWDLATKKELRSLEGQTASVQAVAYSPDGKTLAVGSRDGAARLYDTETGRIRMNLESHKDGVRRLAWSKGGLLATAAGEGVVRVQDGTGKVLATLEASKGGVNCVAWSPDDKVLAATSRPSNNPEPGEVRLWDVVPGEGDAAPTFKARPVLKGHTNAVLTLAFSPDGKTLASGGGTYNSFGEVVLWDVASNRHVATLHGLAAWVEALAFNRDGTRLFSGGGTSGNPGEVRVWQVGERVGWAVNDAHEKGISSGALSADGSSLVTGGSDNIARVWDTVTGKCRATLTGHTSEIVGVAVSPDGRTVASAGGVDGTARLWDVATAKEKEVIARHPSGCRGVSFSADGKLVAVASGNDRIAMQPGSITIVEVATGRAYVPPMAAAGTQPEWSGQAALMVAFSPDGKTLASGGPGGPPSLRIWDLKTGKKITEVAGSISIRYLKFSPDGRTLATGHGGGAQRGDGSVQLWDTTTWKEKLALVGRARLCKHLAWQRDGRTLVSASIDGTVKVWHLTETVNPVPSATKGRTR